VALRRQDGFKDVEILRLEWEFVPPPKGAAAAPGAATVTGSPGPSAASARAGRPRIDGFRSGFRESFRGGGGDTGR
jgi:hypothetical protein